MRRLRAYARVLAGNTILHPLSKLFPRNPKLWAFGAADGRFDGNSKYLFLWMSRRSWPVRLIWITRNPDLARRLQERGFPSLYRWSWKGMAAAARAGLYIVNDNTSDINFSFSAGSRIFNLWHGVGLKNVRYGAHVGYGAELRSHPRNPFARVRNMRRFEEPDWVLGTSPEMAREFFSRCFELPIERVPALGYPRLDPALDEELRQLALSFDDYSMIEVDDKSMRRIIYVPTLRDNAPDLLVSALPDLDRLSAALEIQNAVLFLKLHPKMKVGDNGDLVLPPNIRLLPADLDIYPILHSFDALITDYSSLFFDYIFARSQGVVLYTYDFEQYKARERDLAWDYDEATVGVRANDFSSLCEVIGDGRAFAELDREKLRLLRQRFWDGEPDLPLASEKVAEFLLAVTCPDPRPSANPPLSPGRAQGALP
jgi:CDP-glycerol glycerophosphotransferase (TagB/SpsB family)